MDTEGIKLCVIQSYKESSPAKVLPEGNRKVERGEGPVAVTICISSLFMFPSFSHMTSADSN